MLIKVHKSIFSLSRKFYVYKTKIKKKLSTIYPQKNIEDNLLKIKEIKSKNLHNSQIHTTYYNY